MKLIFILCFISLLSCHSIEKTEEEVANQNFQTALFDLSTSLSNLEVATNQATDEIKSNMSAINAGEKIPLATMKEKWKSKGLDLIKELATIQVCLVNIKNKMNSLFELSDKKLEHLKEHSMYDKMRQDRDQIKIDYQQKIALAQKVMEECRNIEKDVEKFDEVLEFYAVLGTIQDGIREIDNIIQKIVKINNDMKTMI